jgi:hypothetical protein
MWRDAVDLATEGPGRQRCRSDFMATIPTGQVFQATLRVNGADRSQAFVSIDRLTSDVLVKVLPSTLQGVYLDAIDHASGFTLRPALGQPAGNRTCHCCSFRALLQSCVIWLQ